MVQLFVSTGWEFHISRGQKILIYGVLTNLCQQYLSRLMQLKTSQPWPLSKQTKPWISVPNNQGPFPCSLAILRAFSQFKLFRSFRKSFCPFWENLFGKLHISYFLKFPIAYKIRNWAKWSEMLTIILPTIRLSEGFVEKILPVSVLHLGLICVEVIWL